MVDFSTVFISVIVSHLTNTNIKIKLGDQIINIIGNRLNEFHV